MYLYNKIGANKTDFLFHMNRSVFKLDNEKNVLSVPFTLFSSITKAIEDLLDVKISTPKEFLDIMKQNKVDLYSEDNGISLLSCDFSKQFNFSDSSSERLQERVKNIISGIERLNLAINISKDYSGYNSNMRVFTEAFQVKYVSVSSFAYSNILSSVFKNYIKTHFKDSNDFSVYCVGEPSIYFNIKAFKLLGKPLQQIGLNDRVYQYDFPSIPLNINFLKTKTIDDNMLKSFEIQVIDYWKAYKISIIEAESEKVVTDNTSAFFREMFRKFIASVK